MTRRLDIGVASWESPNKLDRTLTTLRQTCATDWRCLVVDNASPDPAVRQVIERHAREEPRIVPLYETENLGYGGAVNRIIAWAETDHIGYSDNDVVFLTPGWDEIMCELLAQHHEIGMIFPSPYGAYPLDRGKYNEILWGVGCQWVLSRWAATEVRGFIAPEDLWFDSTLGHHEEVDFQTRLRLAGWISAQAKQVQIQHDETASTAHESGSRDRIYQGVKRWVEKWERYFGGKRQDYHSVNVQRFELWPTTQLYMEEVFKKALPGLNDNPEVVNILGREFDLIRVPRLKGFYRGRII